VVEATEALKYAFVLILCIVNLHGKIKTLQFKYYWMNYYNWLSTEYAALSESTLNNPVQVPK